MQTTFKQYLMMACAFGLTVAAPSAGLAVTLRAEARSLDGKPVAGLRVVCTAQRAGEDLTPLAGITDANGQVAVELPVDRYRTVRLTVDAPTKAGLAPIAFVATNRAPFTPADRPTKILLAPATSKVAGTVTGEDGKPVPNTVLELVLGDWRAQYRRTATTDKAGRYQIDGLAPGRYVMRSVTPPAGSPWIRLHTWKPSGAAYVSVGERVTATQDFRLPRGARLMGRVLDEAGRPVEGAAVSCSTDAASQVGKSSIYQMPGKNYSAGTATDATGRYVLAALTQETYQVTVTAPERTGLTPAVLRGVNAMQGKDLTVQDVRLQRGGVLVLRVVGPDGAGVAGAALVMTMPDGLHRPRVTKTVATTDEKGRARIGRLPTGKHTLTVRPPAGSALCKKTFKDVAVVAGLTMRRVLKLADGARLSGKVLGPGGKPIAGAQVWVRRGYGQSTGVVTDKDGAFMATGLSPAEGSGRDKLTVRVSPPASAPWAAAASMSVTGLAAGKTTPVTVRLKPAAAISGVVSGPDGQPVGGCLVAAWRRVGRGGITWCGQVYTAEDGGYLVPHVTPGRWSVSVLPPAGCNALPFPGSAKSFAAGKTVKVDVVLKPGAVIVGRVAAGDKPVVGAQVRLELNRRGRQVYIPGMGSRQSVAYTDAAGAFRFAGVPAGAHRLTCSPLDPSLRAEQSTVTVTGTGEHKVAIAVMQTGRIRGTALGADGKPLARGMIRLRFEPVEAGRSGRSAYPDAGGTFQATAVLPGTYKMSVVLTKRAKDLGLAQPPDRDVVVEAGKETRVDVRLAK